jgi:4-methyl-5(b-hydroxyethyl)-thiazole monophosphate biosynthesis
MLFIPGGKAGVENFLSHPGLEEALKQHAAKGKYIAAVCAGPSVPGSLGLLAGRNATCFPGWEDHLIGALTTGQGVVADGPFRTGRGLGFSVDLALRMIEALEGKEKALDIKRRIQHPETV